MPNRQPIYTSVIVNTSGAYSSAALGGMEALSPTNIETLFTASNDSLLERVYVSMATDVGNTSSDMIFYLFYQKSGSGIWIPFAFEVMPTTTVSATVSPASVIFTFAGGMTISTGDLIGIGRNFTSGNTADYYYVTMEVGDYQ